LQESEKSKKQTARVGRRDAGPSGLNQSASGLGGETTGKIRESKPEMREEKTTDAVSVMGVARTVRKHHEIGEWGESGLVGPC